LGRVEGRINVLPQAKFGDTEAAGGLGREVEVRGFETIQNGQFQFEGVPGMTEFVMPWDQGTPPLIQFEGCPTRP
jgi:hypothetical protein